MINRNAISRRAFVGGSFAGAAALALAGCGSNGGNASSSDDKKAVPAVKA